MNAFNQKIAPDEFWPVLSIFEFLKLFFGIENSELENIYFKKESSE